MGATSPQRDFEELYTAAAPGVIHLVYGATGDLTLAQDSTQEAFARAWQRWETISTYDEPLAWVRTVARRVAISTWRKRTRQSAAYAKHGAPRSTEPPNEDRVAVIEALRTLSDPVRETVALFYIADLPIERIATETGIPAGTVKARLHRGRAQLARALQTEEERHA